MKYSLGNIMVIYTFNEEGNCEISLIGKQFPFCAVNQFI